MRAGRLLLFLIFLAGICAAQDTNFSVGPQYLITTESTLFLHPIATPSLSLQPMPPPEAPAIETEPQSGIPPISQPVAGPDQMYLPTVYWGAKWVDHVLGVEETSNEIEITSSEPIAPLPPSLFDPGVAAMSNSTALHEYGAPLGDTASFWKIHKASAPRVYTNEDVKRLHGG